MSSYVEWAEQAAKRDGADLAVTVQALQARGFEGRYLLADGSAYSPSWRALEGGSALWALLSEAPIKGASDGFYAEVQEAYEEQLTREEEALGLYWSEGCLFYESEGFSEAEEAAERERLYGSGSEGEQARLEEDELREERERARRQAEYRERLGAGYRPRDGARLLRKRFAEQARREGEGS